MLHFTLKNLPRAVPGRCGGPSQKEDLVLFGGRGWALDGRTQRWNSSTSICRPRMLVPNVFVQDVHGRASRHRW